MLFKIMPWMVRQEFEKRIRDGQSPWTLKAYRSALIKLEHGIYYMYNCKVRLVPRNLKLPARRARLRRDRLAYTPAQTKNIIDTAYRTELASARVLDLVAWVGLRLHEVLKLRAKDIQGNYLVVFKGKGGKRRELRIPTEAMTLVRQLVNGKTDMNLIFPGVSESMVRYCMEKACRLAGIEVHKIHNLRHSYAVHSYKVKRQAGVGDKEARRSVSKELGHNRVSVTYAYVPPMLRPGRRGD